MLSGGWGSAGQSACWGVEQRITSPGFREAGAGLAESSMRRQREDKEKEARISWIPVFKGGGKELRDGNEGLRIQSCNVPLLTHYIMAAFMAVDEWVWWEQMRWEEGVTGKPRAEPGSSGMCSQRRNSGTDGGKGKGGVEAMGENQQSSPTSQPQRRAFKSWGRGWGRWWGARPRSQTNTYDWCNVLEIGRKKQCVT